MKAELLVMIGLAIAMIACGTIISPSYDESKPPAMLLPTAYQHAVTALGPETNEFHCISATVTDEFVGGGEWYFTFCSTNSKNAPKMIVVGFNGKVIFDNGYR